MQARRFFWILLLLTLFMVPVGSRLAAQSTQSAQFSLTAGTTTQILGSGGANPANTYPITGLVLTSINSGGATVQLVTGPTNGVACSSPTNLSPSINVPYTGTQVSNPGWEIFGNPVFVMTGSAALCGAATGGTVVGWIVFNR